MADAEELVREAVCSLAKDVTARLDAALSALARVRALLEAAEEWNATREAMSDFTRDVTGEGMHDYMALTVRHRIAEREMRAAYRARRAEREGT